MRKLFVTLILPAVLFFVFAFSANATTNVGLTVISSRLEEGLVAHWTFDGEDLTPQVMDEMRAYDGVLSLGATGNTATTTTGGVMGQAIVLDGVNDFIDLPVMQTVETYPFAFSAWFKQTSGTTGTHLIVTQTNLSSSQLVRLYVDNGNVVWRVTGNNGNMQISSSGTNYADGKWHHAVGVSRAINDHQLYVDGVSAGTSNSNSMGTAFVAEALIGKLYNGTNYFNGALDDVRIYSKALTTNDVRALYAIGRALNIVTPALVSEGGKTRVALTPNDTVGGDLALGLVGHWTFDGKNMIPNVADSSGNNNDGVLTLGVTGNTATTTSPGVLGQALVFDGVSDYVNAGAVDGLGGTTNLTVSAWVNTNTLTGGDGGLREVVSQSNTFSATTFILRLNTTSDYMEFLVGGSASYSSTANSGASSIAANTWYHVVAVYDGANLQIYLNGVAAGSPVARTLAVGTDAAELHIGNAWRGGNNDRYWSGAIDDVRVYSRALSQTDILKLYRLGRPSGFAARSLNAPPTPSDVGRLPGNGTNLGGGTQNFPLQMTAWTDPEGDSIEYYFEYYPGSASGCTGTVQNSGWISDPTGTGGFTVSIADGSSNYWRVKARDSKGRESAYNTCYYFANVGGGGSCPYLYIPDGDESEPFRYITDLSGQSIGFTPNHPRAGVVRYYQPHYYSVPGFEPNALGEYVLKIREVIDEITYFDHMRLLLVDHPPGYEIFNSTSEVTYSFGRANPFKIYTAYNARTPLSAVDNYGANITEAVSTIDDETATMEPHNLNYYTFDFGTIEHPENAKLILDMWAFYMDRLYQTSSVPAHVQVMNAQGQWQKVREFGSPSGDIKSVVLDISNIWLTDDHRIRFYPPYTRRVVPLIDRVRLDDSAPVAVETHYLDAASADLYHRGAQSGNANDLTRSGHALDDTLPDNEAYYFYGNFTKYGDVTPLLTGDDDMFVIMRHGDEMKIRFDDAPVLDPAKERSVLLLGDTYYKLYTEGAVPVEQRVTEPLPFHGMTKYPYDTAVENYPQDAAHQQYREEWNTRYYPLPE